MLSLATQWSWTGEAQGLTSLSQQLLRGAGTSLFLKAGAGGAKAGVRGRPERRCRGKSTGDPGQSWPASCHRPSPSGHPGFSSARWEREPLPGMCLEPPLTNTTDCSERLTWHQRPVCVHFARVTPAALPRRGPQIPAPPFTALNERVAVGRPGPGCSPRLQCGPFHSRGGAAAGSPGEAPERQYLPPGNTSTACLFV